MIFLIFSQLYLVAVIIWSRPSFILVPLHITRSLYNSNHIVRELLSILYCNNYHIRTQILSSFANMIYLWYGWTLLGWKLLSLFVRFYDELESKCAHRESKKVSSSQKNYQKFSLYCVLLVKLTLWWFISTSGGRKHWQKGACFAKTSIGIFEHIYSKLLITRFGKKIFHQSCGSQDVC